MLESRVIDVDRFKEKNFVPTTPGWHVALFENGEYISASMLYVYESDKNILYIRINNECHKIDTITLINFVCWLDMQDKEITRYMPELKQDYVRMLRTLNTLSARVH